MARTVRNQKIDTPSARAKLPVQRSVYWVSVAPGCAFGYRKGPKGGTWIAKAVKGETRKETTIGPADDALAADGALALSYTQAQEKARAWFPKALRSDLPGVPSITMAEALDRYEADLRTRGGDLGNVSRVRAHMKAALADKLVPELTARDLRKWRDELAKVLAAATVNRTTTALKAALNLAADQDERIVSRRPWEIGLATIPGADESRNVILEDETIRRLIAEAHSISPEFGLLVEVAAVTGARCSQIARLECRDLQDGEAPRLMIPASAKGKGARSVFRRPVPIPESLARKLEAACKDRGEDDLLLTKPSGQPWRKSDHARPFKRAVERCGLDTDEVTIYALRHSSIVRQILGNVPVRVVAVSHDTSVAMIERTYSRFIADHADQIARGAMLEIEPTQNGPKVVKIQQRAGA